uniref:Uncharacterized protein n=1 Tax=Alexandrium catenella TaxID=2925 RepID=A0A7S1SEC1_ALECA
MAELVNGPMKESSTGRWRCTSVRSAARRRSRSVVSSPRCSSASRAVSRDCSCWRRGCCESRGSPASFAFWTRTANPSASSLKSCFSLRSEVSAVLSSASSWLRSVMMSSEDSSEGARW